MSAEVPKHSKIYRNLFSLYTPYDGGNNQNHMTFILGNATSGAPSTKSNTRLANPPTVIGIIMKTIITRILAVTMTLEVWSSPVKDPSCPSTVRINILRDVPTIPDQALNTVSQNLCGWLRRIIG